MSPSLRRGGAVSAALHVAILLAIILSLPPHQDLPQPEVSAVTMEYAVEPAEVQKAQTPGPTPSPQQAEVPTPDLPSLELPKPALPVPPPPAPPPPLPPLPAPMAAPAPALPVPPIPPSAIAPPAPVTIAPAPLAVAPSKPQPAPPSPTPVPPRPVPPQHATPAPVPPAPPALPPAPPTTAPPAPTTSTTSQPHPSPNLAAESKTLEATLEKLRSLQPQREAPRAVYNPPRGGAPGGGSPTGVDNAKLSAAARGAIGEQIRECYDQDTGARDYDKQSVRLVVTTDAGGTIRQADFAPGETGRTGIALVFAERARRAALNPQCATLPLPPSMKGATHTFEILFKP